LCRVGVFGLTRRNVEESGVKHAWFVDEAPIFDAAVILLLSSRIKMGFPVESVFGDSSVTVTSSLEYLPKFIVRGRLWKATRETHNGDF
jgi:hypothetical protein